jgi:hypothetical protein
MQAPVSGQKLTDNCRLYRYPVVAATDEVLVTAGS